METFTCSILFLGELMRQLGRAQIKRERHVVSATTAKSTLLALRASGKFPTTYPKLPEPRNIPGYRSEAQHTANHVQKLALAEELNKKLLDVDIGEAQKEEEMCITEQQILVPKIKRIGDQMFHTPSLVLLNEVRKTLPTATRQQLITFACEFENNRRAVIKTMKVPGHRKIKPLARDEWDFSLLEEVAEVVVERVLGPSSTSNTSRSLTPANKSVRFTPETDTPIMLAQRTPDGYGASRLVSSNSTPSIGDVVNHLNSSGHVKVSDVQPNKSKKEARKAARKAFQKQKKAEEKERIKKLKSLFRTNPNKVTELLASVNTSANVETNGKRSPGNRKGDTSTRA